MGSPGYKESGKKMGSRYDVSHKQAKELIKKGLMAGRQEVKAQGTPANISCKNWKALNFGPRRMLKTVVKRMYFEDTCNDLYYGVIE